MSLSIRNLDVPCVGRFFDRDGSADWLLRPSRVFCEDNKDIGVLTGTPVQGRGVVLSTKLTTVCNRAMATDTDQPSPNTEFNAIRMDINALLSSIAVLTREVTQVRKVL